MSLLDYATLRSRVEHRTGCDGIEEGEGGEGLFSSASTSPMAASSPPPPPLAASTRLGGSCLPPCPRLPPRVKCSANLRMYIT